MTTFAIDTEDPEILKAVAALLRGFQVEFKEIPALHYSPEFVEMIRESERQIEEGRTVTMEPGSSLWDLVNTK